MSIYSKQTSWSGQCSGSNQSPINLSQSIAKPCNLSCDFKMDDGQATSAMGMISDEGLLLFGNLGSCKFRDTPYQCTALLVNHPSHHTLEGSPADGEVIALFNSPTGEKLCVSSLFKVSSSQTPSLKFFQQFIPYGSSNQIALNDWSLKQMVPSDGSYYTYEGSLIIPDCSPCEWVVFKSMINIDQGDFATLVRTAQAGSRNIQPLGTRELFFNDSNTSSSYLPHDNKTYLVMRPLGKNKNKKPEPLKKADLKTTEAKERAQEPSTLSKTTKAVSEDPNTYIIWLFNILFLGGALYLLYTYSGKIHILTYIYNFFRRLFGKPEFVIPVNIEELPTPPQ
jgi:carbonic anhydrase